MSIPKIEIETRIAGLKSGPWIRLGELAWTKIATPERGRAREDELTTLLRAHWTSDIYEEEGEIRNSFDEALTIFQLYELAIQNGYLRVEDIADEVRLDFERLLWSKGARRYLQYYDYLAVAFLAQRVAFDIGWPQLTLPDISPTQEIRFAAFLSQHFLWYDGDVLENDWLGFLDDYQIIGNDEESDKEIYWRFLTTVRKARKEKQMLRYTAGADRFLSLLADLNGALTEVERPRYGQFYAYWMACFFGYSRNKSGYFRDKKIADWGEALTTSGRLASLSKRTIPPRSTPTAPPLHDEVSHDYAQLLGHRIAQVRDLWSVTLAYMKSPGNEPAPSRVAF